MEKARLTRYFAQMCQTQLPKLFFKKDVFKNFAKFTGNYLCGSVVLMKQVSSLQLYQRHSATDVFLWILGNFQEHLFYRTLPGDYFRCLVTWNFWTIVAVSNLVTLRRKCVFKQNVGRNEVHWYLNSRFWLRQ